MDELDLLGPEPIYVQVADVIAARIAAGTYEVNRAIPSEPALSNEFGIARNTARAATRLLVQRGLVRTVRARGSFVLPPEEPDVSAQDDA